MSLAELFYDPLGAYKDGKKIPAIGGHSGHIHVADDDPAVVLEISKLAKEKYGLTVRENPAFGDAVDPVHTAGSYHYKTGVVKGRRVGLASDISGPESKMRAFFRAVEDLHLGGDDKNVVDVVTGGVAGKVDDVADTASDIANLPATLVKSLVGAFEETGARLLVTVALILGGSMVALYGAMKLAGVSPAGAIQTAVPVTRAAKTMKGASRG